MNKIIEMEHTTTEHKGYSVFWPSFNKDVFYQLGKDQLLATWYMIWGNCMAGFKPPEYFGKMAATLSHQAQLLGFDIYEETDFFNWGKDHKKGKKKKIIPSINAPSISSIAEGVARVKKSFKRFYG